MLSELSIYLCVFVLAVTQLSHDKPNAHMHNNPMPGSHMGTLQVTHLSHINSKQHRITERSNWVDLCGGCCTVRGLCKSSTLSTQTFPTGHRTYIITRMPFSISHHYADADFCVRCCICSTLAVSKK